MNREKIVQFRVSKSMYDELVTLADLSGFTISEYMRRLLEKEVHGI